MLKILSKVIFFTLGWKIVGVKKFPKRCIVAAAPHTSNWDFLYGRCYGYILGIKARYLMKSELFIPLIGQIFRLNGGIPVYRKDKNNVVQQVVELFNNNEELILGIAPEGTRKRVARWKTGFYYMALQANVSIVLVGLDYKLKEIGIITEIKPTGDFEKDMLVIQEKYKGKLGKIPENYNPNIF